jgi:hypothetical protein
MSEFRSYTDKDGNKIKIGDWIEVVTYSEEVKKTGKVARITNEKFFGISVILEGNQYEHINAKNTRRLSQ